MISRIKKYTFIMIISVLYSSLYAQILTNSIIKTLRVKPVDNQRMYTGEDLKFELFIPYISSALVDATDPENTDTLTFVNMHKYSVQGEEDLPSGVRIELTLNFSKKGSYKPSPLIVRIRNIPYQIKFESFSVALNPQEQIPLVVIEFEDGTKIADLVDSNTLVVKLPFLATDAKNINVGDSAKVYLELLGEEVIGTCLKI